MEHLTKAQIVLLTLFVSFVSSMATGIVVVTLMQQAPEPVLQTITRVVEKTIEKVVPTVVEKPGKQTFIKDEDLMVAAIDRNIKSIVVLKVGPENGDTRNVGVGTIVSSNGLVITDKKNFDEGLLTTTIGGVRYNVEVVSKEDSSSLGLGKLVPVSAIGTSTVVTAFIPATLGTNASLKVGQTAIVIGGSDGKTITNGLIASLEEQTLPDVNGKPQKPVISNIGLSVRFSSVSNGAPIISLEGVVIGFLSIDKRLDSQFGIPVGVAKKLFTITTIPVTTTKTEEVKNNLSADVQSAL